MHPVSGNMKTDQENLVESMLVEIVSILIYEPYPDSTTKKVTADTFS